MSNGVVTLAPLLLATLGLLLTAIAGSIRVRLAAPLSIATAILSFAATLYAWWRGGGPVDIAWAPTLNLRLSFAADGLAILYSLLASGIGIAVLAYSWKYLPLHLKHEHQPPTSATRFYGFMLLFMASMIGLVTAQDLILIFLFWDLTAVSSYFLIGFDRYKPDAQESALMALLVTGVSSVLFLIGALMLYVKYDTFSLAVLSHRAAPGWYVTLAVALMIVPALVKSAQVPFHFWLPRAMIAPTPISAYLHSAAMVAAGVFLLSRIYPLVEPSRLLLNVLLAIGFLSMFTGGLLALSSDILKRILAYSTIAQYGYVVVMLGIGGTTGVAAASFYVIAHAIGKSALFLTAGTVIEATGHDRLTEVGGLRRSMPLLATGSALAAADLAALPLTIGFFKDELFFKTALTRGMLIPLLAVAGAALTLAYIWRFWSGLFLGPERGAIRPVAGRLVWPVAVLGALALAGGLYPAPAVHLARFAGETTIGLPVAVEVAYHVGLSQLNLLVLATFGLGVAVTMSRRWWSKAVDQISDLGRHFGPERLYARSLARINRLSAQMLAFETRDLRRRISTILVPAALLAIGGLLASPATDAFEVGPISGGDLLLLLLMGLAAIAALSATRPARHLSIILALSSVGFTLAAIYASLGAPDVALVAVLVEMLVTIIFLSALTLIPKKQLLRQVFSVGERTRHWGDVTVGVFAGLFALLLSWSVLSRPAVESSVSREQILLTPEAHAKDVVTAILADFRGLDTAGEVTVIAIVLIGVFALLREEHHA